MTILVIKRYKYLIASILIVIAVIFLMTQFERKKIYVLYDDSTFFCENVEEYEKNKYHMCDKLGNIIFFQEIKHESIRKINDLSEIELTSKDALFQGLYPKSRYANTSFYLVLNFNDVYEIIPVEIFFSIS